MAAFKYSIISILKILTLVLLLSFPINAYSADSSTNMQDLNNWPPVIRNLEIMQLQDPYNKQVIDALANAYNNYATLLAQDKQWSEAESYMRKAVALNSSAVAAISANLSNIYASHAFELYNDQSSSYENLTHTQTRQLLAQALALNPNNANAYILLGDIEYMDQKMPLALEHWQKAAQLLPNNQDVKNRLDKITRETKTEANMHEKYNAFFTIKIDPDLAYLPDFDINDALNNVRIQVGQDFNYIQQQKIPVVVYTQDQYQETLTDAPNWSEGAYDGKLRIILSKNKINTKQVYTTIVHEYTHAVVGDLTNNNCPRWLNEGIARYEEFKHGVKPQLYMLALAYNNNMIIPWNNIEQYLVSANKQDAILAYQQSFSFVYYLVERYGMIKLINLLKTLGTGLNFEKAVEQNYGLPLINLQNNWKLWLSEFIPHWAEAPETKNYGY